MQENRKKKEIKIGTEPVSERARLTETCYEELKALAEEIGMLHVSTCPRYSVRAYDYGLYI